MKKLTLEKVAELAGVSPATVSRVLNDHINIRAEVRERVRRVIAETGYQPNSAARSLASKRSNIIGMVIPSVVQFVFTDPYIPQLIQGISQSCNEHDFTLSLFLFHSQKEEKRALDRISGSGLVDGVILTADDEDNLFVSRLTEAQIPFVQVGRPQDASQINYVDADNVMGAHMAVTHLIKQGYRRIATIATRNNTAGDDRLTGYRHALIDGGLVYEPDLIAYGDYSESSGYKAMHKLLRRQPDAVFVCTDTMALGALRALHEAKLSIPNDIAIVGFDDLPAAAQANPPLTTIRQPIKQTGMLAVETLIEILQSDTYPPRHIILPTELVVRASSSPVSRN